MTKNVQGRFFIVGCERSGTTLLQAMLARQSRVFSFPESHVFCRLVPKHQGFRRLGLANRRTAAPLLHEFAERCLQVSVEPGDIPKKSVFQRSYARAFSRLVDRATLAAGKDIWVEKTPHHLYQAASIAKLVPGAAFIHILRDGRDVAASIRDASASDPGYWGQWDVAELVDHWNRSVETSLGYRNDPRHHFVSYESLIAAPAEELSILCDFLGIDFEKSMLEGQEAADSVTGWMASRPWMEKVHQPLQDTRLKKYRDVFSQKEKEHLEAHLLFGGRVRELWSRPSHAAAAEVSSWSR